MKKVSSALPMRLAWCNRNDTSEASIAYLTQNRVS
jgi:hypothetical protein